MTPPIAKGNSALEENGTNIPPIKRIQTPANKLAHISNGLMLSIFLFLPLFEIVYKRTLEPFH